MRFNVFLILILVGVGGIIYYKDGGHVPEGMVGWFEKSEDIAEDEPETAATSGSSQTATPNTPILSGEPNSEPVGTFTPSPPLAEYYEPLSPYAGRVTLKKGRASASDVDKEYIELVAASSNDAALTISDWTIESVPTQRTEEIPQGIRTLESTYYRSTKPLTLLPGEQAYLVTGKSPLFVSFRENRCTGYLTNTRTFTPNLGKRCPLPTDELLRYGENIRDDDDRCYTFVSDIRQCETTSDAELDAARLPMSCDQFIENTLSYDGCVDTHKTDTDFFTSGGWRIYLGASRELWLSTHETIRLRDADGGVVAVLQY